MSATSFIERKTDPTSTQIFTAQGGGVDACGVSRVGRQRPENQDRFVLQLLPSEGQPGFFGVADGVGGAPAGQLASGIAVRTAGELLEDALPDLVRADADPGELLRQTVGRCQAAIEGHVAGHPEAWGMATTLTMGCVIWPKLHLAHVGDSRAYLLRGSKLRRLTHDHTCAQALIDRGVLEQGSEGAQRWRNVILNLVGGRSPEVKPDITTVGLHGGDVLLLCSDGLSDSLEESRIAEILRTPAPAEETCRRLVMASQGKDDTTVVVVRFGGHGFFRRLRGWLRPS